MVWYNLCLIILIGVFANESNATPWPYVNNPRITSCKATAAEGACSEAQYASDGVIFYDIVPSVPPARHLVTRIGAYGMHCEHGSSLEGRPFSGCLWVPQPVTRHNPVMVGKCELKNNSSWELTADSTCETGTWGVHVGAGPGGECVIFAQRGTQMGKSLYTPFGVLDADTVANSGNRFCQKALPPGVTCDLIMPDSIDHGSMPTRGNGSVTVRGSVNCGTNPVIAVVGGGEVDVGVGVKSRISTRLLSDTTLALTSDLTVTDAAPGEYRGAFVVRVAPY